MNNLEILRKFVSTQGYKKDSPDKNNPYNIIPSNQITMENVEFPVMGISMETQEKKIMLPNQDYTFDNTKNVIEFPIRQQGGTAGMDGMIKARLAIDSHFGNPTAKRMTNYDTRSYEFPDGNKGNVYVSSYDNLVTPQIQDVNGKLMFIDNPWSEENADRSYNQSMKFEREEDARYFGENYKKYAPMMNLYQQGGGKISNHLNDLKKDAKQQIETNYIKSEKKKENIISTLPKQNQKDTCDTEECATYVSNVTGLNVLGNAWTMKDDIEKNKGTIKYNIYDSIPNFNPKSGKDLKNITDSYYNQIQQTEQKEVRNLLKPGNVVGLYYPPSSYHQKALEEGIDSANTHVGIVTGYANNGDPIITHNIHGKLYHEPYSKLQTSKVAWIGDPSYSRYNNEKEIINNPTNNKYISFANNSFIQQENVLNKGYDIITNFAKNSINNQYKVLNKGYNYITKKLQQGGQMNEEIMNQVAQAIQQGANPDEIVQALIQQGLGEPEAMQLVNNVMSQLETQLPQAQYGMQVTNHNKVSNLNFDNKFNSTALGLNMVSDPRNLTWALPDKGIGSGFKAISGLASGLTGAYLGYAKMFSKDKTRYFDPKEKPIVSSPYIPEGKDVTNIVKPSLNVPTWDWQTQHPDLTAANMAGKASYTVPNKDNTVNNWYNAPGQNTIGPVEFAKGGMKKYQLGQQVDSSMYDFNIESLIPQGYYDFPYPYGKEIQSTNNIQNPWAMQYGDNTNPNPPRQYTRDTVPEQMQRQSYQNYFPGATVDEGSIAMDNYTNQNIYPTNSVNPSNKTSEQLKKEKKYITSRGDSLGFQVANNALIGFQNFNDVLSAKDYEKEYNQMLIDTGNTDQRYNTNNPTNPYGTYTPNVGIGSNYGLVANGPIQDFGTGKFGGMTMAQNGGPKYDIKDPRNPNYKPDYPKKTCGINNNKCYTADGVSKNRDAFISNRSTRTTKNKNINKSKEQQLAYNYNRSTRTTENKNINKSKEQQLAYNYNIPIIVEPDSLQPNIQNNINQRPQKYYKNVRGTIQETTANDPYAMSYEEAMQKNNSITHSNQGSSMSGKDNLFVYQEGGDTLFYNGHTYKLAMEEYKRLQNTPEAWKGDPDFEDENGNLKICVDCLNVDYTNDSDIRDIYTLIKEGYAKEPHYSANEYQAGLIKLGLPTKKFGGMKKKYKEGGQYTLSQEEIDYIINNGGEIEFID